MKTIYQRLKDRRVNEKSARIANAIATTLSNMKQGLTLPEIAKDLELRGSTVFNRDEEYTSLNVIHGIDVLESEKLVVFNDGLYRLTTEK